MHKLLVGLLILMVSKLQATSGDIDQMFRSMLAPGPVVPTEVEFQKTVSEEIDRLSPGEVKNLLPLVQKAVHNCQPEVREFALKFFLAVSFRQAMDSAELLSSCEPDLEEIVAAQNNPLKRLALTTIVFLRPNVPLELVKFLSAHLQDSNNAPEDTGLEAVALVETRDPDLTHKVVQFLEGGKYPFVSAKVLQQFGLMGTKNPEALSFIGSGLSDPTAEVRWEAIAAVSRLPQTERTRFLGRLNEIAADPKESSSIRAQALEAIKN